MYSFQKPRFLTPGINRYGYKHVSLYKNKEGKTWKIHRLVALAFISNPGNKPCIDHIDGNRLNNNVCNLRWVTHRENTNNPYTIKKLRTPRPVLGKPVLCIETNTTYPSAKEAERQTGIKACRINSACNTTAGGYHWKLVEELSESV